VPPGCQQLGVELEGKPYPGLGDSHARERGWKAPKGDNLLYGGRVN
jgi:hypothetical protein